MTQEKYVTQVQFYKWVLVGAVALASPGFTALWAFWGVSMMAEANEEDVAANTKAIEEIRGRITAIQGDVDTVKGATRDIQLQQRSQAEGINWIGCRLEPGCEPPPRRIVPVPPEPEAEGTE